MTTVRAIIERVRAEQTSEAPRIVDEPRSLDVLIPRLLDAETLEWYLGRGQSVFERSPTGAVLDMIAMHAYTSIRCRTCRGEGIVGSIDIIPRLKLLWKEPEKRPLRALIERAFSDCPECHGVGSIKVEEGYRQVYSKEAPFAPLNPIDVKPRAASQASSKSAPDDEDLTRYASVSRRLAQLPRDAERIIRVGWGPEGQSWADIMERGRVWAIVPLTREGSALLKANPGLMPDQNRSMRLDDIASVDYIAQRCSNALATAVRVAAQRLTCAVYRWNEIVESEGVSL